MPGTAYGVFIEGNSVLVLKEGDNYRLPGTKWSSYLKKEETLRGVLKIQLGCEVEVGNSLGPRGKFYNCKLNGKPKDSAQFKDVKELGEMPKDKLDEGIKDYLQWLRYLNSR